MNFDDEDKLELQHLAGGNIVQHAPVFSEHGRFIFVRCGLKLQVFVTSTGEMTRELNDATSPLISVELDLKQPELLLGCTSGGQLLHWHWRTGVLQKSVDLKLGIDNQQIVTCNLLNLYKGGGDTACAFVTVKRRSGEQLSWFVVNTSTGLPIDIVCGLKIKIRTPVVDIGKGAFKYILFAQGSYLYFLNYETWKFWRYKNVDNHLITCVRMNPNEEMAATGDETGRVIVWRQFDRQETVLCAEYHWHATPVTSLAFSPTGISFFSAGHESVLVKWSLSDSKPSFLPRMPAIIRHIVISDGMEHVLVCTEDNALQFVRPTNMKVLRSLQHFTYALQDKTGRSMFPLGLCLNPRTNSMVLNGRVGQLQFYSAYTKSLLYNVRVVDSNVNSEEMKRVIYNTNVTRAAFNINWMATGEEYNDELNFPELRLKFWMYHEKLQTYQLNTNIELPHEHGFQAIIFSNQSLVKNLRCASAGKDNVIKLWTLGDSENIYKRGVMWTCAAQTSFKQQTLVSMCFSQDGSILAAGYGHTLVLFDGRTLRLLHSLSTSAGYDGVVSKAQLRLSQTAINGTRSELTQQRQQLWNLLQTLLNSNDQKLVEQARQLMSSAPSGQCRASKAQAPKETVKESVYKHIMQMSELGLHQKLQLLRRFGIECIVHESYQMRLRSYLKNCAADPQSVQKRLLTLQARLHRLQPTKRFKAKQRLERLKQRRANHEKRVRQELLPLFSVLQLDETTKPATMPAEKRKHWESKPAARLGKAMTPLQCSAQISHVQFGAGAQAHLVAICTETRVLIWNLMTLRLQAGLKLSVRQLAFDPLTNLIAAITRNDELHVFQPNVPLPVYQRSNLPKLHGLVWLPRRQPKQSSINVDWQAQSTLHMLTHDKEIVYLAAPGQSLTDDAPAPISFAQQTEGDQLLQYATFGTFVARRTTNENTEIARQSGPLIIGRGVHSAVNALVNLSAHTMPAMSLICGEFIKSLLTPTESEAKRNGEAEETLQNGKLNGNGHIGSDMDENDEEEEDEEHVESTTEVRKILLEQNSALEKVNSKEEEQMTLDARLQRIAKLNVYLDF